MTNQEIILDMIAGNFDEYINEVDNLRRRNIEMGNELEYQEKVKVYQFYTDLPTICPQ